MKRVRVIQQLIIKVKCFIIIFVSVLTIVFYSDFELRFLSTSKFIKRNRYHLILGS